MADISVIIPTRNRAALLGKCLASLCEQTLDPARFEVCVVDNGSTDMTDKVIPLVSSHYPKHKIFKIDEPNLGVAFARNSGIRNTTAALVVQGDDDITAPPDWLERFLVSFASESNDIGKIGGDVIPVWGAERPEWLTDEMLPLLSASSGLGDKPKYVDEGLFEGNCCYRREAIEKAGCFPTTLGRKANSLLSAENAVDLVMQVNGWKLYYDPTILVHHNIHADRLKPAWFRRRYFWQGVSDYAIYMYLQSRGIEPPRAVALDMPFDPSNWSFINKADEAPTLQTLYRLRSLGFVLASSGFIPIS